MQLTTMTHSYAFALYFYIDIFYAFILCVLLSSVIINVSISVDSSACIRLEVERQKDIAQRERAMLHQTTQSLPSSLFLPPLKVSVCLASMGHLYSGGCFIGLLFAHNGFVNSLDGS